MLSSLCSWTPVRTLTLPGDKMTKQLSITLLTVLVIVCLTVCAYDYKKILSGSWVKLTVSNLVLLGFSAGFAASSIMWISIT
jgi:hypothetical protein